MELLMTTTSTIPEQLALMGRHIDRLVTVEARISPTSRNVIVHLYEAACAAQGGGPLSMLAAQQILKNLGPGKTVFLTTGAGDPRCLPARPTDRRASPRWPSPSTPPPARCRCCSPRRPSVPTSRQRRWLQASAS